VWQPTPGSARKRSSREESYETQKAYYQKKIEETPGWEFTGIYADKAKTGTKAKNRPGFQQMIADAESGKIDIILCKNVARFSRNVGICQEYVDKLNANNVTVIFEKENIRTDDPTSNFNLALLGAISQDESNSIGLNRRWAYQKRFEQGEYNIGNNRVLGYDTVDGKLVPNQDAWIIREIFERYVAEKVTRVSAEH
jgi:DNA invertase Pin-like site-specific DNA recombinase